MLYAEIQMEQYPLGWEELEFKCKKLRQFNWSYKLEVGRQMFSLKAPQYQFTLVKWGHRPDINTPAKHEVLYEGHDFYAVLGFVSMLLKAEEEMR
jgi:hypothetical protein